MNPLRRTTLLIGRPSKGFTFVEVMVTLVVLSAGIVCVYKSFFLCVDYLTRISMRMHASQLIDTKIADIDRLYRINGNLSFSREPLTVSQTVNHKRTDFNYQIDIASIPNYDGLYRLEVGVSWLDAGRPEKRSRVSTLSL